MLFLAVGGKAVITGQDVPDGVRSLLVVVLGAGLGAEPLSNLAAKITARKEKDGDKE